MPEPLHSVNLREKTMATDVESPSVNVHGSGDSSNNSIGFDHNRGLTLTE
jgi:hypothetical protein